MGDSANPTEVIPHASITTDIASSLAKKQYATTEVVTYPDYLSQYGEEIRAKFDVWAATFGSCDPKGVYANAFLFNVATSFNGDVWLQCATNLPTADWKDVESGRYIDEKGAFLHCLIDFEHMLTPGSFSTEPEGTKTIKVFAH